MTLYLVIPCYNEAPVLPHTASVLSELICSLIRSGRIDEASRILFVDDGSRDKTWPIIERLFQSDSHFCGIRLSRNRGHQNALLCGMEWAHSRCNAVITMDADLQDDPDAIGQMLAQYAEGADIVYGIRGSRKTDSAFKRITARCYYHLMENMGVELIHDHADFRLMSRRAISALLTFPERNLFLRGLVPMVGYRTATVTYDRGQRIAGVSKYPLRRMVEFAFEGITSLSVRPIRLILALGITLTLLSLLAAPVLLILHLTKALSLTLSHLLLLSVWLCSGLILTALGTVGEYAGKIYLEVKHRPHYLIEQILSHEEGSQPPFQPMQ